MICGSMTNLDVPARLYFASISAILRHNLLLVWYILYPVNVLCPASAHLTLYREGRQASEDQHRRATARCIMYGSSEALCSNVDVHNDALRLASQSGVAVGHRKSNHLGKLALGHCLLICIYVPHLDR
jgi:hypothetical protein